MIHNEFRTSKTGIRRFVFRIGDVVLANVLLQGLREVGAKNIQQRLSGWNAYCNGELDLKDVHNVISCDALFSWQIDKLWRKKI